MGKKKERQRKLPPSTSFVLYVIMSLSTEQRGLIVLALGIASLWRPFFTLLYTEDNQRFEFNSGFVIRIHWSKQPRSWPKFSRPSTDPISYDHAVKAKLISNEIGPIEGDFPGRRPWSKSFKIQMNEWTLWRSTAEQTRAYQHLLSNPAERKLVQ